MLINQLEREDLEQKKKFSDLMGYCFKMCNVEEFEKDWESFTPEVGTIMGSWDGDALASAIMISHRRIMLNGEAVKMDGLGGVATSPLYRKGGVCSKLIKSGLENMYQTGAVFSALAPFSYPFYEKLGWKWSYSYLDYCFSMEELSSFKMKEKVELLKVNHEEELKNFYTQTIQGINGISDRMDWNWEKRFELAPYRLVVRNQQGDIVGYMLYDICQEKSLFKVWEIQYSGKSTIETLFSYIYNHCGQVSQVGIVAPDYLELRDVLKNPRIECKNNSHMMLRIINVEEALKLYHYRKEGSFNIQVKDNVCEWNNQVIKVIIEGENRVKVEKTTDEPQISVDIRELVQVIIGFRTLDEVEHEGELEGYFKSARDKVALCDSF